MLKLLILLWIVFDQAIYRTILVSTAIATTIGENELDYRLPKNVQPDFYTISLWLDLKTSIVSGNVSILLRVVQPTDSIALNARGLTANWTETTLNRNGKLIPNDDFLIKENEEIFILKFGELLTMGEYTLTFPSFFSRATNGLHVSSYSNNDENGFGLILDIFC